MRKILVIGGGIGGLSTAVALQRHGLEAHVYEAAPRLEAVGKGIWLPPNAMRVLERRGRAAVLAGRGVPLERIELRDREEGLLLGLDLRPIEAECGHTTVSLHRAALQEVLADDVQPGTLHLGKRCTGLTQGGEGVAAQFADGTRAEGDLLVGADGIHSVVRRALFPSAELRYAGQTCYRGIAELELSDSLARTCWEVWGGELRFGFSAIGRRQVYWFAPVTAPAGSATPDGPMPAEIVESLAAFPSPIPEILAATPADGILRTDLYDLAPLERWWQGRVVLVGDAAHAMTPNLGQGGAQAIEDASTLASELTSRRAPADALRRYEDLRRARVRRMVRAARRYGQLAHLRNRPLRKLRNAAVRWSPEWVRRRRVAWLYGLESSGRG